jgi:hypothetical protein
MRRDIGTDQKGDPLVGHWHSKDLSVARIAFRKQNPWTLQINRSISATFEARAFHSRPSTAPSGI